MLQNERTYVTMETEKSTITLYHGTWLPIPHIDLNYCTPIADFGQGFYLTANYDMACKWASQNETAVVNVYELDPTKLNTIPFKLNEQWLRFVASNRQFCLQKYDVSYADIILGPTTDASLTNILQSFYQKNTIGLEDALHCVDQLKLSPQIALKNENAIQCTKFAGYEKLSPEQHKYYAEIDRKEKCKVVEYVDNYIKNHSSKYTPPQIIDNAIQHPFVQIQKEDLYELEQYLHSRD